MGRSAVGKFINGGGVRVNGRVVRLSSWEVDENDRLDFARAVPQGPDGRPLPSVLGAQAGRGGPGGTDGPAIADGPDGPAIADGTDERGAWAWTEAWLVADDGDLVVLDKPSGLRAEPVRPSDDRANLLALARTRFGPSLVLAHRLDRDTSGLLIATRPGSIRSVLDAAFKAHGVEKTYEAVVSSPGRLADHGEINARIGPAPKGRMQVVARGGEWARTRYTRDGVRVSLEPETGRTHQLRVHLASMDAPILGDRLYEGGPADRLHLHAARLGLPDGRGWGRPPEF